MDAISQAAGSSPVVDITGQVLDLKLYYADKSSSKQVQTDHDLAPFLSLLNIPPTLLTFLQTPLSQTFDDFWSQTKDSNKQTSHDCVTTEITNALAGSLENVSVNLVTSGPLRAAVVYEETQATTLYFSYELTGNSLSAAIPHKRFLLVGDASFRLTFDIEVLIKIDIPQVYGSITMTPSLHLKFADNPIGTDLDDDTFQLISNVLPGLKQSLEDTISAQAANIPFDFSTISNLATDLTTAWSNAQSYGFKQLTALISQQQPVLRFIHPIDLAPVTNAAIPSVLSFLAPQIQTAPEALLGQSTVINGYNFSVQDKDFFTITSPDQISITAATNQVEFYLVLKPPETQKWLIGSTSLTTKGSFSATITIPIDATPPIPVGNCLLDAVKNGAVVASTSIEIVVPFIQNRRYAAIGDPFEVTFSFYQPQTITLFLESKVGRKRRTPLGTTTSTGPATFTTTFPSYPAAAFGSHKLVAQGSDTSQPQAEPSPVVGYPRAKAVIPFLVFYMAWMYLWRAIFSFLFKASH